MSHPWIGAGISNSMIERSCPRWNYNRWWLSYCLYIPSIALLSCLPWIIKMPWGELPYKKAHITKNGRWSLTNNQWRTEALRHQPMMIWVFQLTHEWPWEQTFPQPRLGMMAGPANTLMTAWMWALWSCKHPTFNPAPTDLWDKKCLLF